MHKNDLACSFPPGVRPLGPRMEDEEPMVYTREQEIQDERMGDGFGSNEFARSHAFQTQIARSSDMIGGKAAVTEKARHFTKNGLQAVLFGAPAYSTLDAVMGYKWSLVFVGNEGAVKKFLDKTIGDTGESDDLQVEVIK